MERNRVTCLKLCYALGVAKEALIADFPVIWRKASDLSYFSGAVDLHNFRKCNIVYRAAFKMSYRPDSNGVVEDLCLKAVEDTFEAEEANIDFAKMYKELPLLDFLDSVVSIQTSLARNAYRFLELRLPFDDFQNLTELTKVDSNGYTRLKYIMSHVHTKYHLYFPNRDVFNVSTLHLWSSDISLRDRVGLSAGKRMDSLIDKSILGVELERYTDDVYVDIEHLAQYDVVLVDCATVNEHRVDSIRSLLHNSKTMAVLADDFGECLSHTGNSTKRYCIVTRNEKDIAANLEDRTDIDFAVFMPISYKHYNKWKQRHNTNLYLLGYK